MSLKYSSTTADYLQWSEAMNLIRKLAKDGNYKISLLVALGCFILSFSINYLSKIKCCLE